MCGYASAQALQGNNIGSKGQDWRSGASPSVSGWISASDLLNEQIYQANGLGYPVDMFVSESPPTLD